MAGQDSEHADKRTITKGRDFSSQRNVVAHVNASECQQEFESKLRQMRNSVDRNSSYHLLITGFLHGLEATWTSNSQKANAAIDQIKQAIKHAKEEAEHALPSANVDGMERDTLEHLGQRIRELERQNTALTSQVSRYEWNDRVNSASRELDIEPNEDLAQQPGELPDSRNGTRDIPRREATKAVKVAKPTRPFAKPVNVTMERHDAVGDKSGGTSQSSPESYFGLLGDYENEAGSNQGGENMTVLDDFSEYLPMSASCTERNKVEVKEVDTKQETEVSNVWSVNRAKEMVPYVRENIGSVLLRHPIQLGIGLFQIVAGLLVWKEMTDAQVERNHWMNANGLSRLYLLQSLAYQRWGSV